MDKLIYIRIIHIISSIFLFSVIAHTQQLGLPWINKLSTIENISNIVTIKTEAEVQVSDGLTYKTKTLYHDPQRAIFQRIYVDRTIVQGIEGKYIWSFNGSEEKEVSSIVGGIILGHQFHAQILFFDQLHPEHESVTHSEFKGQNCYMLSSKSENPTFNFYYKENDFPLGMEIIREEEANITFEFDDWREVSGVRMPYAILIDDGERLFEYRIQKIEFNEGSISDFKAPEPLLTEEQKLMRHHRTIIDGHFFGTPAIIKMQQSDTMTIVGDGEVSILVGDQTGTMIEQILASRDYTVYDDLIRPIINISDDGTLAWVIAQIFAKGNKYGENSNPGLPFEFTCSWIELYGKENNYWKMNGIVSNFKAP